MASKGQIDRQAQRIYMGGGGGIAIIKAIPEQQQTYIISFTITLTFHSSTCIKKGANLTGGGGRVGGWVGKQPLALVSDVYTDQTLLCIPHF